VRLAVKAEIYGLERAAFALSALQDCRSASIAPPGLFADNNAGG
jgi:hypothetical protein